MATTVQRGYGAHHKQARARIAKVVNAGQAWCARCTGWITPGTPWDLDHDDTRAGYLGASHRWCNRHAGVVKRELLRRQRTTMWTRW